MSTFTTAFDALSFCYYGYQREMTTEPPPVIMRYEIKDCRARGPCTTEFIVSRNKVKDLPAFGGYVRNLCYFLRVTFNRDDSVCDHLFRGWTIAVIEEGRAQYESFDLIYTCNDHNVPSTAIVLYRYSYSIS